MTYTDKNTEKSRRELFRKYAIKTVKVLSTVLLLTAMVHISWNMFAPDMFGLEAIRMKQALGLIVFGGTFVALFRFGRLGKHSPNAG